MDGRLSQPDHQRSAISKDVRINYKISSIHDAIKTLATMLALVTNLADWKPAQSPRQKQQPKLVNFLEQVICQLVSPSGRDWQYKFKAHKHIGLTILIKVQRIISKLTLAAGDPDVGE